LERAYFKDVVLKAWSSPCPQSDPMEVWQNKIRSLRKMVRGWANNVIAELNKHKQAVAVEYNWLDEEGENRNLSSEEKNRYGLWRRLGSDKVLGIEI
jgi:hypothetical protein